MKKNITSPVLHAVAFMLLATSSLALSQPIPQQKFTQLQNTLSQKPVEKLLQADRIQILRYQMPNVAGKNAEATAMVIFPQTVKPKNGWPVVVWAHGTVGVGDACAPSNNPINDNFAVLANSLLKAGYVVIAPDYEGLGTPGIHPYLNLKSEANSVMYAVQATQQKYAGQLNTGWMVVGQSQGGHASLGVAEFAARDPNFKGAVATAPASSLGQIITEIAPKEIVQLQEAEQKGQYPEGSAVQVYAQLLTFGALVATGIRAYDPSFKLDRMFQSRSLRIANTAGGINGDDGLCFEPLVEVFVKDIQDYLKVNSAKHLLDYPGFKPGFEKDPVIAKFLKDNQPATKPNKKPLYVVQGKEDDLVPYQVTEQIVQRLNQQSSRKVKLDVVEKASHKQAILDKNADVVEFIQKYLPAQ